MSGPILIGGTGRSGTHVVGHLLGRHPDCHLVPRELVFHGSRAGLAGLRRGTVELERFIADMRGTWWERRPKHDRSITRGLHKSFERPAVERAVATFAFEFPRHPGQAIRAMLDSLIAPEMGGARRWVEMSPTNATAADVLLEAIPDARLIHVVRDGRDVACSMAALPWGPGDVPSALRRWARTLAEIDAAGAGFRDRVLVVHLEELVLVDRDAQYDRLLRWLELPDDPACRSFFDADMTPQRAHLAAGSRTCRSTSGPRRTRCTPRSWPRCESPWVACAPPLWDVGPFRLAAPDPAAARIDPWADGVAADA